MAIPAVSNIALNVILIPRMGLMGAAVASAASFALGLGGSWLLGRKALALPVPLMELTRIGLCTAAMMAVVAATPSLFGGLLDAAIKAAAGGSVYAALAWLLDLNGVRALAAPMIDRLRRKISPQGAAS